MSLGERSDLSSSCCTSIESSEEQDRGPSPFSRQIYLTGSSCAPLSWDERLCSPRHSYGQDSDSDCQGNFSLPLAGLRGNVSQADPCYARPFCKDVERDVREEEDEFSVVDSSTNEGIIFYNDVRCSACVHFLSAVVEFYQS